MEDKLTELQDRFESELQKASAHVDRINSDRVERRRMNLPDIGSGRGMMACFGAMPIVDGCTRQES